jgi:nitrogen fixation-related uncharacterized protein
MMAASSLGIALTLIILIYGVLLWAIKSGHKED